MLLDNLRILCRLYYRPLAAMSEIIDEGSLLFGALAVLAVSALLDLGTASVGVGLNSVASFFAPISTLSTVFSLALLFHGDIGDVSWSFGARQSLKRYLEAATINPRDAGAHYQLGLIHQHRHQVPEAIERFKRAVEIDPTELDAHYQLGRIARQEQRHEDAIKHFDAVLTRDERFARYEVWREVGATYLESGSFEHSRWALEKYTAQRTHDPEGLYFFGSALARLGEAEAAGRQFQACLEAADTTPSYRRREVRRWRKLAEQQLGGKA